MSEKDGPADNELADVLEALSATHDLERRLGSIFRRTFDQLYDGQHTGRYAWGQLYKTEKTHSGTLVEINLRREFTDLIEDGTKLDFQIAGHEIDCKYSFRMGGWMLPPECFGQLLLVCNADDENSEWAVGVVRAAPEFLRSSSNRDGKTGLNEEGRRSIAWVFRGAPMAPNVLLQLDHGERDRVFAGSSGQQRVNELFRVATRRRVGRNAVATVAQQDDYMKRVRANGGARSALAAEGILIPGGDYESHRAIARALNVEVPEPGEFVSVRVTPGTLDDPFVVELDGRLWRTAGPSDPPVTAPTLPKTRLVADD
ncbi:MAG TPA: NaeI family type II restriction endonuclease [Pseudolysinimonas sp.]|nr:NaeI family type II restriction endonuclease [Pseudolysinimonas sp.]